MAEVPRPVRQVLRDPVDEASFQRMWRSVGVRRARSWHGGDRRAAWMVAPMAAAVLLGALVALALWNEAAPAVQPGIAEQPTQAIERSHPDDPIRLADGSQVLPARGSELEVLERTHTRFATRLGRGSARFEVQPGGSRQWSVDCGLALVTVMGTAFEVERTDERVRVAVERGVVQVDDRVNHRSVMLRAGELVVIERISPPSGSDPAGEPEPEPEPEAEAEAEAEPSPAVSGPSNAAPTWSSLAQEGEYHRAFAMLGRDGISREAREATPEELLALADVARLGGHPAAAVAPLERLLETHPNDANAGLAAFTLGIVHVDQLGDAAAAARAFERALDLGLPPPLHEDALGRLAIARGRSGDMEGAARDAARYLERYPEGGRRAEVARWVR